MIKRLLFPVSILLLLSDMVLPDTIPYSEQYFRSYRPNYFVFDHRGDAKFQISQAMKLFSFRWGERAYIPDLWISYTAKSLWDLSEESVPFRETNYNPDLFLAWQRDVGERGFSVSEVKVGYSHESNGLAGDVSRSWDRIFIEATLNYSTETQERLILYIRPWLVAAKSGLNSDIEDYCGSFEIISVIKTHYFRWAVAARLSKDRPAKYPRLQLDLTFKPRKDRMGFYIYGQVFSGYGESLIDYKHETMEFRVGIEIVK